MKIQLVMGVAGTNDLLILDEPTNHLDIYSREALEQSLVEFQGSILLISHDRYLLQSVCNSMIVFNSRKIQRIEGFREQQFYMQEAEGKTEAQRKQNKKELILLLETRISALLGELNRLDSEDPEYKVLDGHLIYLLRQRRELD